MRESFEGARRWGTLKVIIWSCNASHQVEGGGAILIGKGGGGAVFPISNVAALKLL